MIEDKEVKEEEVVESPSKHKAEEKTKAHLWVRIIPKSAIVEQEAEKIEWKGEGEGERERGKKARRITQGASWVNQEALEFICNSRALWRKWKEKARECSSS